MNFNEKSLSIAIDPAGIGTTGIVAKTFNGLYPRKWSKIIKANNPVNAAVLIIEYISKIASQMKSKDYDLKEVIVEMPHSGNEKWKEIKATRELVGILRFYYKGKFKGHLPNHKDKKLLESWKDDGRTSHEHDAEAIMLAHFKEKERNLTCESAWWGELCKK